MKILIEVTQDHINKGFIGQPKLCPVALAISDKVKGDVEVLVDKAGIHYKNNIAWISLGKKVLAWLDTYDTLGKNAVQPFSFRIEVFPDYVKGPNP